MKTKNQDEENWTLKEKILYGLGSIIVLTGSILLGRRIVKKSIANKEENRSLEEGTPATWAKQIKMAFDNDGWFGTDTEKLRKTLREIPSKEEFNKVTKSYKKLYNSNFFNDLSDELQSTQYNEMLSIIATKPEKKGGKSVDLGKQYESWAKRLKAAFEKTYGFLPGTDEDAIKAVFTEIPTQAAFLETAKAYAKEYNSNLTEDLKGELEIWEYPSYMQIITSKPQA